MKSFFQLLTKIISLLEKFGTEKKGKSSSLEAFVLWLNREVLLGKKATYKKPGPYQPGTHAPRANVQLALLLHMLSKHYKLYSKKVLLDSDLVSMDGHTFLSTIYHTDSVRKMEVIHAYQV